MQLNYCRSVNGSSCLLCRGYRNIILEKYLVLVQVQGQKTLLSQKLEIQCAPALFFNSSEKTTQISILGKMLTGATYLKFQKHFSLMHYVHYCWSFSHPLCFPLQFILTESVTCPLNNICWRYCKDEHYQLFRKSSI